MKAFFVDGQDIGRIEVLTRLAAEVGLDPAAFEAPLVNRNYQETHRRALRHAND